MIVMKYVVVKSEEAGEQIFIFPKEVNHSDFAEIVSYIKWYPPNNFYIESCRDWKRIYRKPIAAGFTDGQSCYGRSESLDLDSRPEDTKLLKGDK